MEKVVYSLIYSISPKDKDAELEWLRDQKIFPGCSDSYNWTTGEIWVKIGVIVTPTAAVAIKLRHKVDVQREYKQR